MLDNVSLSLFEFMFLGGVWGTRVNVVEGLVS